MHRNVANVVVHTDLNFLSVLQYAVDILASKHVIVCGHYGCGGVAAALAGARHGLIDNWLRHVADVAEKHDDELAALPRERRIDRLCELNVIEQVENVCETTIVGDAWARGQPLTVHGLVYGLDDGLLRDLGVSVSGGGGSAMGAERAVVVRPGEGHRVGNVEFLARSADTPRFNFSIITKQPGEGPPAPRARR